MVNILHYSYKAIEDVSWQSVESLVSGSNPSLAGSQDGYIYMSYNPPGKTGVNLMYKTVIGGSWTSPTTVVTGTCFPCDHVMPWAYFPRGDAKIYGEMVSGMSVLVERPCCDPPDANLLDDDCTAATIGNWSDSDQGTGVSRQVAFDGKSCFKFDTGAAAGAGNRAERIQDIGELSNTTIIEIALYHDAIGTKTNVDYFAAHFSHDDTRLTIVWATDGVYVNDGDATTKITGSDNWVQQDVWQTWILSCDFSTPVSATVDICLDGEVVVTGVDCSQTGSFTDGQVRLVQRGDTNANRISYVDYVKIGDATENEYGVNGTYYVKMSGSITPVIPNAFLNNYRGAVISGGA